MAEVIQGHDDQSRYQRQLPDKVMHPDPVTLETAERPNDIKKQDWAFVARLRAAILNGLESAASVLRHLWLFIFLVAVGLVWLAWFASGVEILVGDIRELGLMHSCR